MSLKTINTGIINKATGKQYILTEYYQEGDNKHFTQEQATEIGEKMDGFHLCTDQFHKDLKKAVWHEGRSAWKKNALGSKLTGFEYLTHKLGYELSGYHMDGTDGLRCGSDYCPPWGYSWSSLFNGVASGVYLGFTSGTIKPSIENDPKNGYPVRFLQD